MTQIILSFHDQFRHNIFLNPPSLNSYFRIDLVRNGHIKRITD